MVEPNAQSHEMHPSTDTLSLNSVSHASDWQRRVPAFLAREPMPTQAAHAFSSAPLPAISVVIPLLDEAESLWPLYRQLKSVLDGLQRPYEILFVDDGSTDDSAQTLAAIHQSDPHTVQVIQFRRNFGQTAAFSAGFHLAQGQIVITMDADLQNDPADIPRLLAKLEEGYDIVSGWRVARQEPFWVRRLPSLLANRLISWMTGVHLHDYGCSLKAYRQEVVKSLQLYGEMHRFIPALASWMGVTVAEIPVHHAPRRFGRSKYNLWRTFKVLLDLLTVKFLLDFATRPIQIFGLVGSLCFMGGLLIGGYLSFQKLFLQAQLADRPLLLLAVLLTVLGMQLITMGLLGEMQMRTYHESQGKTTYVIRRHYGRPSPPPDVDGE